MEEVDRKSSFESAAKGCMYLIYRYVSGEMRGVQKAFV